jgi:hypothetical protein
MALRPRTEREYAAPLTIAGGRRRTLLERLRRWLLAYL